MSKREALFIVAGICIGPIIVDLIVWLPLGSVGNQETWIGFFGTYIGGIIGGAVAFYVARIQAKTELAKANADMQRQAREDTEQRRRKGIEERLNRLYAPAHAVISDTAQTYGAHLFHQLPRIEQNRFMKVIGDNISYADAELEMMYRELKWNLAIVHPQSTDLKTMQVQYQYIRELVYESFQDFREKLGMPSWSLSAQQSVDLTAKYAELEARYFPDGYDEDVFVLGDRLDIKRLEPEQHIEAVHLADELLSAIVQATYELNSIWNTRDGFRHLAHATSKLNEVCILPLELIGTSAHGKADNLKRLAFTIRDLLVSIRDQYVSQITPEKLFDLSTSKSAKEMISLILSRLVVSQKDVGLVKRELIEELLA